MWCRAIRGFARHRRTHPAKEWWKESWEKGGAINIHQFLARTDEIIYKAEVIIGVFFTVVMIVVVFLQVIFRYIIHNPLSWSEEFCRYIFIWACMLGASIGIKKKAHFGMDTIFRLIPESKRKIVEIFLYILIGSFLMVLVYYGINLCRDIYQQTAPGLEISMSIPYSAIPVGALLMLVHVLLMPFKNQNKDGNRLC